MSKKKEEKVEVTPKPTRVNDVRLTLLDYFKECENKINNLNFRLNERNRGKRR